MTLTDHINAAWFSLLVLALITVGPALLHEWRCRSNERRILGRKIR